MPKRVAIYARYSSDLQNARSTDDQIHVCKNLIRDDERLINVFSDDALSGQRKDNRPGLLNLMKLINTKAVDVVICEETSRLARKMQDIAEIHDLATFNNIELRTVADGRVNRMHVGVNGLIADMHREEISRRTKRGHIGNVREGKSAGGLAFGYRKVRGENGMREIDEAQAEIVREIFHRVGNGESPTSIARDLNQRGVPTARGGKWYGSTILGAQNKPSSIIRNEIYIGKIVYNRMSYPIDPRTRQKSTRVNPHDEWCINSVPKLRIVTNEIWERAQQEIQRRADAKHMPEHFTRSACPYKYLIGRKLHHSCGAHMRIRHQQSYVCSSGHVGYQCQVKKRISGRKIRHSCLAQIAGWSDAQIKGYVKRFKGVSASAQKEVMQYEAKLEADRIKLVRYHDAIAQGIKLDDDLTKRINELKSTIEKGDAHLRQYNDLHVCHPIEAVALERIRARAAELLAGGDDDIIDRFLDGLVERIVVGGKTGADMTHVEMDFAWANISRNSPKKSALN